MLAETLRDCARQAEVDLDLARFEFFDAKAAACLDCATVRVFVHRECGAGVATPRSCHVRGEPDCERARVARLLERFDAVAAEMARPVFWTFTLRNVRPGLLAEGLDGLRKAWSKVRRRAPFSGGGCRWRWRDVGPDGMPDGAPGHPCHRPDPAPECMAPVCSHGCTARRGGEHAATCRRGCPTRTGRQRSRCLTHPPALARNDRCPPECAHAAHDKGANCPDFEHPPVRGGVAAIDLTWSEADGGTWHPHLHDLMDAGWIGWAEMRDTWQAVTCTTPRCRHGASSRCTGSWMVWVEAVPTDDDDGRRGAIREVLKYVAKPHGIIDSGDAERIGEYLWATRRLKLVSGFGRFYHLQVEECERADDQIEVPGFGFEKYHLPRICPHCGRETTADDWLNPDIKPRVEAVRLPDGRYGWWPPPTPAT